MKINIIIKHKQDTRRISPRLLKKIATIYPKYMIINLSTINGHFQHQILCLVRKTKKFSKLMDLLVIMQLTSFSKKEFINHIFGVLKQ